VEVKLRIADSASFSRLKLLLLPYFLKLHDQENYFFDGKEKELSSKRVVLRLRFYDVDSKAVLTCKGKQVLKDGVGRAAEEEEDVDPEKARAFLKDPESLLSHDSSLISKLREEFGLTGLTSLGGFKNLRSVYKWKGYTLEIDETSYPWGTIFEIECETDAPEEMKHQLSDFLNLHSISFSDSTKSKFANFVDKTLE
jgi:uncharacterized protein YjbK